jgi:hypothetical protein
MPLSTFLTFLAFLTRKLRRLAVEQTCSLLDGLVRAWLIEAAGEQDRQPRYPSVAGQPATFFRGTNTRKARKVRKIRKVRKVRKVRKGALLLQHGCDLATIAHAISRNSDATASGVIGAVLDKILLAEREGRR